MTPDVSRRTLLGGLAGLGAGALVGAAPAEAGGQRRGDRTAVVVIAAAGVVLTVAALTLLAVGTPRREVSP